MTSSFAFIHAHCCRPALLAFVVACAATAGCGSDDPGDLQYDVTIAVLGTTVALGALQFDVSYDGASGGWVGHQGDVECEALVDALMAANYVGEGTVKIGLVSIEGIPAPDPVVRCGFRGPLEISTSSFVVQVVDASDTSSAPVEPMPAMRVSSVVTR